MLPWKRALGPLAGLLLAVTVTVTPAAAVSAATVHPARPAPAKVSASNWNDYSCKPSAAHPRPVVLVHGTFGNSVDNWLALAPYLTHRGYCVFSLDYGQLPGVPVFYGLGPIEASAGQLATYVDKVLAATGAQKADIVGHSQGGMMPNWYLKFLGGAAKTNAMIGIGADNHGTTLSGLARMLTYYPEAKDLLTERTPGLADQLVGSPFLTRLNKDGDTVPGVHYTVISTRYDQVVTPYRSQYLSGPDVHNVLVQDLCPLDLSDHVAIGTVDKVAFHEVANALDPAHATPTTCASASGA
ncbi:lipase [Streptomyces sp. 150FB]|uniref:esterase/lipase family protein n=1 Tax=Streptomyces sp. 150FB TaxID=1576605 RepID=UPI0005895883|nr:alpha/beta fold hydrolase [Streptomyces sp. 150FB]KIF73782.1 lipase [Streptomyces sp. 150FB]